MHPLLDSMQTKAKTDKCCDSSTLIEDKECYKVEAIVSVDERGQMVLPKDIRERFGLKTGDKLAVVIMEKGGKICCLQLLKAQSFSEPVKGMIGSAQANSR